MRWMTWRAISARSYQKEVYKEQLRDKAGGSLRTGTRPTLNTLNLHLHLRTSV